MRASTSDKAQSEAAILARDLRVVLGQLTRRLREQGGALDLTRSQAAVLTELDRRGLATTSELARTAGMRPQSMAAIVTALEQRGYIYRVPDAADARKTMLALNDSTREQFADGRLAREDWLFRAISTECGADDQKRLSRAIELLQRIANTP